MIERLRKIAFLRALPDEVLTDWCTQLEEHRISPRETVIREGDAANEMYFFIEGQLSVHKTSPDGQLYKVATLKAGEVPFFGEGAAFDTDPRSATVVSDTSCYTVKVTRGAFEWFCQKYPEHALPICLTMVRGVMQRLRKANTDLLYFYRNKSAA
jgi:CRP/FNR family cyclic AMP-dependent transcriptional regulator